MKGKGKEIKMGISNVEYGNYGSNTYSIPKQNSSQQGNSGTQSVGDMIRARMDEIAEKVKNGETEQSFQIGGQSFTEKEWDKLLSKIDTLIDKVNEEQTAQQEKQSTGEKKSTEEVKEEQILELLRDRTKPVSEADETKKAPYSYLAKDGIVEYNGVTFVCDYKHNALTLGDTSNKKDCLNIPLSGGGRLIVNRDNLGDLSKAIGMFSPEDVNLIMRAIAQDTKLQQMQNEIEDDKNSIGDGNTNVSE